MFSTLVLAIYAVLQWQGGLPGGGGSCRVADGRFGRCLNVLLATHIMHCRLECRRKGFPAVVEIAGHLADALESAGPNAAVEIDAAMKREVTAQTLRFSVSRPASDGGKRKAGSSRRHHSTSMRGVAPSLALCTRSVLLLPSKPYAVPESRGFWSAHPGLCAVDLRLWTQS